MREVRSAFEHVSHEQYYRRPLRQGLRGEFATVLEQIDEALETIERNNRFIVRNRLTSEMQGLNTEHMLKHLRLSQSDLARINEELHGVDEISQDNAEKAHASASLVERLTDSLETTRERVQQGNASIAEMNRMGEKITGVLELIKQIAEKTNLLALNASIEAARAGEHGRGFAVVADEVKKLAQNTKEATEEIDGVVARFRDDSAEMMENSESIAGMTEEVANETRGLRDRFREFSETAERTHSAVEFAATVAFTSLIKVDHLIYKQNGYQAFREGDQSEAAEAVRVDHHQCRLGQWYDNQASEKYRGLAAFDALDEPHRRVHQRMAEVLDLMEEDWETDPDIQQQILDTYRASEDASEEVFQGIERMISERYPDRA